MNAWHPVLLRCLDLNVCFYVMSEARAKELIDECLLKGGWQFKFEEVPV